MLRVPIALFASYALLKMCESALLEGYALSGSPVIVLLLGGMLFLLGLGRNEERARGFFARVLR
jgi:hypothetical protein